MSIMSVQNPGITQNLMQNPTEEQKNRLLPNINAEWYRLRTYANDKEAYLFRYLMNQAEKNSTTTVEAFIHLFSAFKNLTFGSNKFLATSNELFIASRYIEANRKMVDFDLVTFWETVRLQAPHLQLTASQDANQIRFFMRGLHRDTLTQVETLKMKGILEVWEDFRTRHAELPECKTEEEMHAFIDNNKDIVTKVTHSEMTTVLAKTTRLPYQVKYLTGLKKLVFSNRKARVLPKTLYGLPKLKKLIVNYSEIAKLSKKIGNFKKNRTKICFTGTLIQKLPDSLRKLAIGKVKIVDKQDKLLLQIFLNGTE